MNLNYLGLILTTTSLIFETDDNYKKQCFYVKNGCAFLSPYKDLIFTDYVENKLYKLSNNVIVLSINAKDNVIPSFMECTNYSDYSKLHTDEIANNNNILSIYFKKIKNLYSTDLSEEEIYKIKTQFR